MRPSWALAAVAVHGVGAQLLDSSPPLQWLNLDSHTTGAKPPPLKDASLGYDSATNTLVLFGGESAGHSFPSTTYVLDMQSLQWSIPPVPQPPIPTSQPPGRSQAVAGPDLAANYRDDFVIFGGRGADGPLNDIWMYNYAFRFWYQVPTPSSGPSPRWGAVGGTDPTSTGVSLQNNFYVAGGMDDEQSFPLSDVWNMTITGVLQQNTQTVTATWTQVTTSSQGGLIGQAGTVMGNGRLVAFGGCAAGSVTAPNSSCAEQNAFSLATNPLSTQWSSAPGCPAARFSASLTPNLNLALSGFQSQVFMTMGSIDRTRWADDTDAEHGEVAILDVDQATWGLVIPSGDPAQNPQYPINRQGAAIVSHVFGTIGADTIIFGGEDASGNLLNDMWILRAYPGMVTDQAPRWTGFGDGNLQSGPNATGAGVTVQFKSDCAVAIKPAPSPSTTSGSSGTPSTGTPSSGNGGTMNAAVFSTSVIHKSLSPTSAALVLAAVLFFRMSSKQTSSTGLPEHRMGLVYLSWLLGATAYILGVVGFVISLATTSKAVASVKRSTRNEGAFLATTHGKAGFAIFLALYGAIPILVTLGRCMPSLSRSIGERFEDEKLSAVRSDKSTDMSITLRRRTSLTLSANGTGDAGLNHERQRTSSTPIRKFLEPGKWSRQRRLSEGDAQADPPSADAPKAFEVIRPHRRSDSQGLLMGSERSSHARQQPSFSRMLSDINWMERRRSIGAINELDYAMSRLTPDPSLPMTPLEPNLLANASHLRLGKPPTPPTTLVAFSHIALHSAILAACVLSLIALRSDAPVAAFAVFLVWCVACYAAIFALAWRGQPQGSLLAVIIYRLRGQSEDRHITSVVEPLSPTRPEPMPLQGHPNLPSSSSSRGPYTYHQPPYRLAPSHPDDEDAPGRGISPFSAPSGDGDAEDDDEEDENERQHRLEQEMERRDVTIISVPRKRLFITNS